MHSRLRSICAAIALISSAGIAPAQTPGTLRAAAEKAVNTNPDVTARFNALRAAGDAVDVVRGGLFPRVDLNAGAGRDEERVSTRNPESQSITRSGVGLSLTQLLWDGLGTKNEIDRLSHDRLARYFELLEVTELTALEAARAHFDVQRYRRLVQLAEENYVHHRYAYDLIQSRVRAGVSRGVDLEQAAARVALAESNLATEQANLYDVTTRYQRIVGDAPPPQLQALTMLRQGLPASGTELLGAALRQSPAISASIENLRAARSSADARRSAYQPRVEARVRANAGKNLDGVQDQNRSNAAELVLNWNLYNGGSDQARVRQQVNLFNQAADQRDRACRDTRQNASIAFNDTRKLTEQLVYLERNTLAMEKTRQAYRQQFEIGQRSLLDLLNSENELYTAKRSYANADHDLAFAYARAQAAINQLSATLGIARTDTVANDAAGWTQGDDAPERCPVMAGDITTTSRQELDRRAAELAAQVPPPPPAASAPRRP